MDERLAEVRKMDNDLAMIDPRRGVNPDAINELIERYGHIAEFPGVSVDTKRALQKVREDLMKIIDTRDYR